MTRTGIPLPVPVPNHEAMTTKGDLHGRLFHF